MIRRAPAHMRLLRNTHPFFASNPIMRTRLSLQSHFLCSYSLQSNTDYSSLPKHASLGHAFRVRQRLFSLCRIPFSLTCFRRIPSHPLQSPFLFVSFLEMSLSILGQKKYIVFQHLIYSSNHFTWEKKCAVTWTRQLTAPYQHLHQKYLDSIFHDSRFMCVLT